jgi:hypothetical protein
MLGQAGDRGDRCVGQTNLVGGALETVAVGEPWVAPGVVAKLVPVGHCAACSVRTRLHPGAVQKQRQLDVSVGQRLQ